MASKRYLPVVFMILAAALLAACGGGNQAAIETGIAQTQQISQLETAAAGAAAATATPEPEEAPTATQETAAGVTTIQDLNMRAGDSTAYEIMTVIPGDDIVEIVGVNQAGTWYQVRYHDAIGWISMGYTNGEAPANLPVATPSAKPQTSSGNSGGGGSSGGGDNDSYSFTLDVSYDGQSKTVQGKLTPGDKDTVTVKFEGFGGSVDTGHLQVILECSAYEDDVELSESIPRSNHSNECDGDWDYQIEPSDSQLVIGMEAPSSLGGDVDWTMTVKVRNN